MKLLYVKNGGRVVMPRGQAVPVESRFPTPTKLSVVIDATTKQKLALITGLLVPSFGRVPSQGEVLTHIINYYLEQNQDN